MNEVNRRDFLKYSASAAAVISIPIPSGAQKTSFTHHYLVIGASEGEFTFYMDKAEMGQGVITGQATLFCEELDLAPEKLKILPAPVDAVYGTLAGMQLTGGSTSTPDRWQVLREAGARIRKALVAAAAKKWSVPPEKITTDNGFVLQNGQKLSYNSLAGDLTLEKGNSVSLKEKKDFKYIGKYDQKVDATEKSTGQAEFGIDFKTQGMLTAIVLRAPSFGDRLKSFDASTALTFPGIKHVVAISSGVAVVAEKYWQLLKVRDQVKVVWTPGKNRKLSSASIQAEYKKKLQKEKGKSAHTVGDVDKIFEENQAKQILVEYELPYLAHATMEPMNAVARVQKDRADIWVGTQGPTMIQNEAADFLGLPRDKVKVHNMKYLGGGFGRRSTLDYPMEAVELSKEINSPVKIVWSREDDTRHSPMRPINRHHMRGLIKDGKAVAWEHRIGCESLIQDFMPSVIPHMLPEWMPKFLRGGLASATDQALSLFDIHMTTAEGAKTDYDIPNQYVGLQTLDLEIPIHFWRSVGHSYNGFVTESFVDEMAHAAGKDPYQFRRELLKKQKRSLAVLDQVAKMSAWTSPTNSTHRGIAYHFSFGSYVAQVAEVSVSEQTISVDRVYCAIDCGTAINPDIIHDQIKSSIIYGLSTALGGEINLVNGGVEQSNFHDYWVVRMADSPEIVVSIIDSDESPMGVGEPGLPPTAAAVGNALFAATGHRLRSLPLKMP